MTDSSGIPPSGFRGPRLPQPGQTRAGGAAGGFQADLDRAAATPGRLPDARPPERQTLLFLIRVVRQQLDYAASATLSGSSPGGFGGTGGSGGPPAGLGDGLLQWWLGRMGQPAAPGQPGPAPAAPAPKPARTEGGAEAAQASPDDPAPAGSDALFAEPVSEASERFDVPERLIRAVIRAESDFNPDAVSHAGAQGLMQLMPGTAADLGVTDPFDPRQNIMGGTRYLRMLLDRYDGDRELALAAYNWGMGNLERNPDPLPSETVNYVRKIHDLLGESTA
jgi:hypothetical protein